MFAPYTSIPTNLLFFDRAGPTQELWYYAQPVPTGRKNYMKTAPIQFEEFADCLAWWHKSLESVRGYLRNSGALSERAIAALVRGDGR